MGFDNLILTVESRASRSFVMHLAIRETDWQTEHRVKWSSDFHFPITQQILWLLQESGIRDYIR
jgi:hypothetical protein